MCNISALVGFSFRIYHNGGSNGRKRPSTAFHPLLQIIEWIWNFPGASRGYETALEADFADDGCHLFCLYTPSSRVRKRRELIFRPKISYISPHALRYHSLRRSACRRSHIWVISAQSCKTVSENVSRVLVDLGRQKAALNVQKQRITPLNSPLVPGYLTNLQIRLWFMSNKLADGPDVIRFQKY